MKDKKKKKPNKTEGTLLLNKEVKTLTPLQELDKSLTELKITTDLFKPSDHYFSLNDRGLVNLPKPTLNFSHGAEPPPVLNFINSIYVKELRTAIDAMYRDFGGEEEVKNPSKQSVSDVARKLSIDPRTLEKFMDPSKSIDHKVLQRLILEFKSVIIGKYENQVSFINECIDDKDLIGIILDIWYPSNLAIKEYKESLSGALNFVKEVFNNFWENYPIGDLSKLLDHVDEYQQQENFPDPKKVSIYSGKLPKFNKMPKEISEALGAKEEHERMDTRVILITPKLETSLMSYLPDWDKFILKPNPRKNKK